MRKIRVLLAKPGLDGHDRGAKTIARVLRDAGMEVIYTGLRQTIDQVVAAAIHEDVDIIGLSVLSGAHLGIAEKITKKLKEEEVNDMYLLMGGVIPKEDIPKLKELGISEVFPADTPMHQVVEYIGAFLGSR